MSAGSAVSKEWSPRIAAKGCVVIDNSSYWRYDQDVPLIVPEVNADAVRGYTKKNIIANPNCSTAQMVVVLKPLHDAATIKRGRRSTYQSVLGRRQGGDGRAVGADQSQVRARPGIRAEEVSEADRLQLHSSHRRLHGGRLHERGMEDAGRDEEDLDPRIKLTATCVRVPVFVGHSESINIEFENLITADEAREILRECAGCGGGRQARAGRLRDAGRSGGRVCDLCFAHPRGCDGRERPRAVGRSRQPAQGRRAQCGADRRDDGLAQPASRRWRA